MLDRIASVANANEGKIVKVKGYVYRQGKHVIEVVSTFLYHGHFLIIRIPLKLLKNPITLSPSRTMQLSVF